MWFKCFLMICLETVGYHTIQTHVGSVRENDLFAAQMAYPLMWLWTGLLFDMVSYDATMWPLMWLEMVGYFRHIASTKFL